MDKLLDSIRRSYSAKDLWVKSGKRACRSFLGVYPRFDFQQLFEAMFKEMLITQRSRGSLLRGELIQSFFLRLAHMQKLSGEIDPDEQAGFSGSLINLCHYGNLSQGNLYLTFNSSNAKARMLMACFELGKRKSQRGNQLSVHLLLGSTFDKPLFSERDPSDGELIFGYSCNDKYEQIVSSPEFHIAVAEYYGALKYSHAVQKLALEYASLEEAYIIISPKTSPNESESVFRDNYLMMKQNSGMIDWKDWL